MAIKVFSKDTSWVIFVSFRIFINELAQGEMIEFKHTTWVIFALLRMLD